MGGVQGNGVVSGNNPAVRPLSVASEASSCSDPPTCGVQGILRTSCELPVFMDQAAEAVPSLEVAEGGSGPVGEGL
jgi:hypothetical protein